MKEKVKKISENIEKIEGKVNLVTTKVNNSVDNFKSTTNNLNEAVNGVNQLLSNVEGVKDTFLQSKKINADSELALKKIEENNKVIHKNIENEYNKQNRAMDSAEKTIDKGLESGDIDFVKAGLDAMTNVANHNPMADLKNHLDSHIEKDFDDDDFTIDI